MLIKKFSKKKKKRTYADKELKTEVKGVFVCAFATEKKTFPQIFLKSMLIKSLILFVCTFKKELSRK